MKRITATALFALATLVTAGSVLAQENTVQANVPFDFSVGNTLLPTGTYRIKSVSPNVVSIVNSEKNIAIYTVSLTGDKPSGSRSKLVFNRYGDQYFLNEIVSESAARSIQIPRSKLEKRVQWQVGQLKTHDQTFVAIK